MKKKVWIYLNYIYLVLVLLLISSQLNTCLRNIYRIIDSHNLVSKFIILSLPITAAINFNYFTKNKQLKILGGFFFSIFIIIILRTMYVIINK
jgi:hypothetical protein